MKKLLFIVLLILISYISLSYAQTLITNDIDQNSLYWEDAVKSPFFLVAEENDREYEWRYGDTERTPTIITGIVIVAPDTLWAYSSPAEGWYYHLPIAEVGDTISFSTRDEGVSKQNSNWVVPIRYVRPHGISDRRKNENNTPRRPRNRRW